MSIFQQNRDLWQKRASSTSAADTALVVLQQVTQPQSAILTTHSPKPQSAILTRNRLQPDLVMDLPPPSSQDNVTPPLSSGSTSASSSMTSLDKQTIEDPINEETEDETLGDHFAKQNQSTLKKNEKFVTASESMTKKCEKTVVEPATSSKSNNPKLDDVVLRIDETNESVNLSRLSSGSASSLMKIELEKSPIPMRNTQKFVSQFADLKLTGGCSTIAKTATTPTQPITTQAEKSEKERSNFSFGSFKPAISIKPQIFQKKKSIFLQAHSSSTSSSNHPSDNQQ